MAKRDDILDYIERRLDVSSFKDYGPQGLQICGTEDVTRIVVGVSCSMEMFDAALMLDADLILTHHGLFWDHDPRILSQQIRQQTELLIDTRMSLASYHLPLDAHMGLGNNYCLAEAIDRDGYVQHFADIGVGLETTKPMHLDAVAYMLGHHARVMPRHRFTETAPKTVERIAILSGRGGRYFKQAIDEGYDLFITGEAEEWSQAMAREYNTGFFALGHYDSERLGVQALARELQDVFDVDWQFVDVPNPV